jgi:hypothetical protein
VCLGGMIDAVDKMVLGCRSIYTRANLAVGLAWTGFLPPQPDEFFFDEMWSYVVDYISFFPSLPMNRYK